MARLKNHFEFIAGLHMDGELYFNKYSLGIDFYTLSDSQEDQNIALDRISYFIYDTVARSIFINENEFERINLLTKAGISVLTVPDPGPFDPVVLATIITKMNSILENVLVITEAEMVSEISAPLIYVWDAADDEDEVHDVVNNADAVKWWASSAPRFGSYPDGVDVAIIEEKSPFPLTWSMLNLAWPSEEFSEEDKELVIDSIRKTTSKQGTLIKADFSPDNKKPTTPKKK